MLGKPCEADYCSYGAYVLAAVGYAVLDGAFSGDCDGPAAVSGVVRSGVRRVFDGVDPGMEAVETALRLGGGPGWVARGFSGGRVESVAGSTTGAGVSGDAAAGVGGGSVGGVGVAAGVGGVSCGSRGRNWERNQQWKADRKARKLRKQGNWRAGAGPLPDVAVDVEAEQGRGYFSDLSAETQAKLKESRAAALIARNEREVREHRERISAMDSPAAIFMKAMDMLGIAEKAAKKANDSKVAGWVATIATSHSESIAKSGGFSGVESFDSKTSFQSSGSVKVVPKKWRLRVLSANRLEAIVLSNGTMSSDEVERARVKRLRQLNDDDFFIGELAGKLTPGQKKVNPWQASSGVGASKAVWKSNSRFLSLEDEYAE